MMKKRLFLLLLAAFTATTALPAVAQDVIVPEGYELVDSLCRVPAPLLDSTNFGRNIFQSLPSEGAGAVRIFQTRTLQSAFHDVMRSNPSRKMTGYRIRIYFDNSQNARSASAAVSHSFSAAHPGIGVYRTYESPFFKVTVGDFRTRSEALAFLQTIKGQYPSAFILKGTISYPPVYPERPYVVDTVLVMRKQP